MDCYTHTKVMEKLLCNRSEALQDSVPGFITWLKRATHGKQGTARDARACVLFASMQSICNRLNFMLGRCKQWNDRLTHLANSVDSLALCSSSCIVIGGHDGRKVPAPTPQRLHEAALPAVLHYCTQPGILCRKSSQLLSSSLVHDACSTVA